MIFNLIEKTYGPWRGRVWRSEEMSPREAIRRNEKMTVMQWEPTASGVLDMQAEINTLREALAANFKAHKKERLCGKCLRIFLHTHDAERESK